MKNTVSETVSEKDVASEFELRRKKLLDFIIANPPTTSGNFTPEPEEDFHAPDTLEYERNVMSKSNRHAQVDKKSSQHR